MQTVLVKLQQEKSSSYSI